MVESSCMITVDKYGDEQPAPTQPITAGCWVNHCVLDLGDVTLFRVKCLVLFAAPIVVLLPGFAVFCLLEKHSPVPVVTTSSMMILSVWWEACYAW